MTIYFLHTNFQIKYRIIFKTINAHKCGKIQLNRLSGDKKI